MTQSTPSPAVCWRRPPSRPARPLHRGHSRPLRRPTRAEATRAPPTRPQPGPLSDPRPGRPDAAPAKPANDFSFGKTELNAKKGTATLPVDVPGAGKLELEGKDVKPVTANASRASTVELGVKAKGDLAKKLKKKGKATAKVEVTFTPTGGDANTQDASVKLKLKKK